MSHTSVKARTVRAAAPPRPRGVQPWWAVPALWLSIALVALTVAVFAPVRTFGFVPWDDPLYVTENARVLAGLTWRGVVWAMATGESFYWHPLTWLTHMLDVDLYGLNAGGHHVTSVILHVLATLVLFDALRRMTHNDGRSAFVAALFAVHPLHVESVAWIAERKDVLSGLFFMMTVWTYGWYARAPGFRRYLAVLACFVLALMSKPMVVTLPLVLLLLDVWPLGRARLAGRARAAGESEQGNHPPLGGGVAWGALLREKIPLLVLSIAAGVATVLNQQQAGSMRTLGAFPLGRRLANAVTSYVAYITDAAWPAGLAAFYPYPVSSPAWWLLTAALLALVVVSVLAVWTLPRRPYLAVGWFWYLVTLLPVIGLIQVGVQARADRFTYIPLVGLCLMVAWGVPALFARWRHARVALAALALALVAASATVARAQVGYWKDGYTLWERAAAVTTGNYQAYASLGQLLEADGKLDEAIARYRQACPFMIESSGLRTRIGNLLMQQGRPAEAVAEFKLALASQPNNAVAHHNLALALEADGRADEALAEHFAAVRCQPDSAVGRHTLGLALGKQGRENEAITELAEAVRLRPDWALAHNSLGLALARQGRLADAIREWLETVRVEPNNPDWHSNLSLAFTQAGDIPHAIEQLQLALNLAPQHPAAPMWHYNLAALFDRTGDRAKAVEHLDAALALNPQYEPARRALADLSASRR
ncbi:MAG: tetratricopeptide repeat protein [Bacteroidales bacterium]